MRILTWTSWRHRQITFDYLNEETKDSDLFFNPTGTKMYLLGEDTPTIYQYTLSTPWDVSTASYDSKLKDISAQENRPTSLFFTPDGQTMYIIGRYTRRVYQYTLSTPWDVSTANYTTKNCNCDPELTDSYGLFFGKNGRKFYIVDADTPTIYQYSLAEA